MGVEIFLGRPSVLTSAQDAMAARWIAWARSRGLELSSVPRSDYATDSWEQLKSAIQRTRGVLILGFPQLVAQSAVWREGTTEEVWAEKVWTSPWLQIEAGMALMASKPTLVVCDRAVREGVFSPNRWTSRLFGAVIDDVGLSESADRWVATIGATESP